MAYGETNMYGRLGGASPSAGVLADAYNVPPASKAICKVVIANRGAAGSVRLSHAPRGAVDDLSQYLIYDLMLEANRSICTDSIVLGPGDKLRVQSSTGLVAFSVNGEEERVKV